MTQWCFSRRSPRETDKDEPSDSFPATRRQKLLSLRKEKRIRKKQEPFCRGTRPLRRIRFVRRKSFVVHLWRRLNVFGHLAFLPPTHNGPESRETFARAYHYVFNVGIDARVGIKKQKTDLYTFRTFRVTTRG